MISATEKPAWAERVIQDLARKIYMQTVAVGLVTTGGVDFDKAFEEAFIAAELFVTKTLEKSEKEIL